MDENMNDMKRRNSGSNCDGLRRAPAGGSMLRVNWYVENGSLCRRVWDFQNERWRKHEEIGLVEAAGMLQRLENESLSSNVKHEG